MVGAARCHWCPRLGAVPMRGSTSGGGRSSWRGQWVWGRLHGGRTRCVAVPETVAGARRGVPVRPRREARADRAIACSRRTFPKRGGGQSPPEPSTYTFLHGLGGPSFPKRDFLGRVEPSRMWGGEKDQNQILRFAGGSTGPYRRFSHGCCSVYKPNTPDL